MDIGVDYLAIVLLVVIIELIFFSVAFIFFLFDLYVLSEDFSATKIMRSETSRLTTSEMLDFNVTLF